MINKPYPYFFEYQIKKNEIGVTCSTCRVEQRCIQDFGGEPEGKEPVERPRRRWEDNIKMGL